MLCRSDDLHADCLQILYLKGLKYLYRLHVFLYSMVAFMLLTGLYLGIRGPDKWKRYKVGAVMARQQLA